MGLDVTLWKRGKTEEEDECITLDSAEHPDHLFKIGYFRSSYNSSGIEVAGETLLGLRPLAHCFPQDGRPDTDWARARDRALVVADKFRTTDPLFALATFSPREPTARSSAEAIRAVREELKRASDRFPSYSSNKGAFFLNEPLRLIAAVPGVNVIEEPCTFLVYRSEDASEHYAQAMDIVAETCAYALAQDDPQSFYLHWSG